MVIFEIFRLSLILSVRAEEALTQLEQIASFAHWITEAKGFATSKGG